MITKDQLLASMKHETETIKHLAEKVPEDAYDYRPTQEQRSMLELMQYMTCMAIIPAINAVRNDGWDHAEAISKETESVTPQNFADAMDTQMARLTEIIADVDESAATTAAATMPWGTPTTQGAALVDMPLKCLVAYRMQFFLYIKAAGVADIGAANCWAGMDQPAPAAS